MTEPLRAAAAAAPMAEGTSHWTETAVTNQGNTMLNESMAGRKVVLTKATGGTGSSETLAELTALADEKQTLKIIDDRVDEEGRTICVQIENAPEEYKLQQIGLWGHLENMGADPEPTQDALIMVMQDKDPVPVPDTSATSFLMEVYATLKITNNGRFEISVDKTAIVSIDYLDRRLEEHNTDPFSHLLKDDNDESAYFRMGVEDGKLYVVEVQDSEQV